MAHVYERAVGVSVGAGKGTTLHVGLRLRACVRAHVCVCVCAHRLWAHQEHRLSRPPLCTWGHRTCVPGAGTGRIHLGPIGHWIQLLLSFTYVYTHTRMYLFMCTQIFLLFTFIITFIFLYSLHLDPECSFESYFAFFNLKMVS